MESVVFPHNSIQFYAQDVRLSLNSAPIGRLHSNAGHVDVSVSCQNKEDKRTLHNFFRNTSSGKRHAEMVVAGILHLVSSGAIPGPILANHRTENVFWVDHLRGDLVTFA